MYFSPFDGVTTVDRSVKRFSLRGLPELGFFIVVQPRPPDLAAMTGEVVPPDMCIYNQREIHGTIQTVVRLDAEAPSPSERPSHGERRPGQNDRRASITVGTYPSLIFDNTDSRGTYHLGAFAGHGREVGWLRLGYDKEAHWGERNRKFRKPSEKESINGGPVDSRHAIEGREFKIHWQVHGWSLRRDLFLFSAGLLTGTSRDPRLVHIR
ncbi:hypothetical protein DFH07DRAFT_774680 [Mycena maculata]|uniref:Uncharacterized protein n=1 Tax=Mycena maculata TaxID=230809 RepID=A0AAD7N8X6_9AGAR|nr:hypothetical protein DFH07DRAFT_774680 [Mycena maculata]